MARMDGSGVKVKARSVIWVLLVSGRDPNTWAIFLRFSKNINRELNQEKRCWDGKHFQ